MEIESYFNSFGDKIEILKLSNFWGDKRKDKSYKIEKFGGRIFSIVV